MSILPFTGTPSSKSIGLLITCTSKLMSNWWYSMVNHLALWLVSFVVKEAKSFCQWLKNIVKGEGNWQEAIVCFDCFGQMFVCLMLRRDDNPLHFQEQDGERKREREPVLLPWLLFHLDSLMQGVLQDKAEKWLKLEFREEHAKQLYCFLSLGEESSTRNL